MYHQDTLKIFSSQYLGMFAVSRILFVCNFWEMSLSNFILIHIRVWRVVKHMEKNAST